MANPWRSFRISLLVVILSLIFVACTDGDTTTNATDTGPDGDNGSSADEPVRGGQLVIAIDAEPIGFNGPSDSFPSPGTLSLAAAVYDVVTAPTVDGDFIGFLADSVAANDDATVWTVTLRDGLSFSDGTALDAAAVKFNVDRHRDEGFGGLELVDAVEVVDDLTLEITMSSPWGTFPVSAASQLGWLASPTAVAELGNMSNQPVGAGPYQLVEWVRGDSLTFERNENYWRDDVAFLDEVVFRIIPDPDARLAALLAGDVDVAQVLPSAARELTDEFQVTETSAAVDLIYLNTSRPPLDDLRVRQALVHALDREALVGSVWEGVGSVTDSALPSDHPFAVDVDYPSYSVDEARGLVEEYEAETGQAVEFELSVSTDPTSQLLAQAVQDQWSQVGIEVTLGAPTEEGAHAQQVIGHEYDAAVFGHPQFLDPDVWWNPIWLSTGVLNVTRMDNPELDAALTAARESADIEVRRENYALVQHELASYIPAVFIRGQVQVEAAHSYVRGLGELSFPDGTPMPYGQEFRVPFTIESLWRNDAG